MVNPMAPKPVAPLAKMASLEKLAMAVENYVKLYTKVLARNTKPKVIRRALRMLDRHTKPYHNAQQFSAIYKMPKPQREKLMKMLYEL